MRGGSKDGRGRCQHHTPTSKPLQPSSHPNLQTTPTSKPQLQTTPTSNPPKPPDHPNLQTAGSIEAVFYQWSMRGGSTDGGKALLEEAIAAVREAAFSQVCERDLPINTR